MRRFSLSSLLSDVVQRFCAVAYILFLVAGFVFLEGCVVFRSSPSVKGMVPVRVRMEVTGYDSGKKSCNWKRDWLFRPVIASGPDAGKRKAVGVTASGTRARRGTIAADTSHYPFGTVMYVPGYGWGTVEDCGSAIKGPKRLDLWFSSEREALRWGRRKDVPVTVYYPKESR